jgi:hypothetical protein
LLELFGRIDFAEGRRSLSEWGVEEENVKLVTPTATMTIRGVHLVIFAGLDRATEVDMLACNSLRRAIPATMGRTISLVTSKSNARLRTNMERIG